MTNRPVSGMRIVEDDSLVETIEDWSGVRSRARAERRRKRGFPQRVAYRHVPMQAAYRVGDMLVMHPEIARKLREAAG